MSMTIDLVEKGWIPDTLTRGGIRRLLRQRLRDESSPEGGLQRQAFIDSLPASPLAVEQRAANQQHYEVPARFYELCLGNRLKYSSGWFDAGVTNLDVAEEAMLARSVAHADLRDGQDILEIGCGWGSLTLYMAERFPGSRIRAISNSHSQRMFITARAKARGLINVTVETCDVTVFDPQMRFDRVVSVECFEHLRNYAELFRRIRSWLNPKGLLWCHIFCHKSYAYPFEVAGEDNWLGRHFFTGGQMPSFDLFRRFDEHLRVEDAVAVNGTHYAKTARCWLDNLDRNVDEAERVLAATAPGVDPTILVNRWRMFFMSCEELWNYANGDEWLVGHYRLVPA